MKITKLVQSCLLVEVDNNKVLVDPGIYSWQDETVRNFDLSGINNVIVTHNGPDHLNNNFVVAIQKSSPNTNWYGTQAVIEQLETMGIAGKTYSDDKNIRFIESEHADLSPWVKKQPEHTSYVLFDNLLISGDCHTLTSMHGARILAGAINGGPQ